MSAVQNIGVDIIEIQRIRHACKRWGDTFLHRIFTAAEITCGRASKLPYQHFAGRFAAKEAIFKACDGISRVRLQWTDIEIMNAPNGRPQVRFSMGVRRRMKVRVHLSISHSREYAVATALALAAR